MASKDDNGLIIVYTGDGKGKTTAALGLTVRAVGRGKRVEIVQFIKGTWKYGEQEGLKRLAPEARMTHYGKGFVGILNDDKPRQEHIDAAKNTLKEAEKLADGCDVLVLDEVNVALDLELLTWDEVKAFLLSRPKALTVVCTGRGAPEELIEVADLVTEMREIKHPFKNGIPAQPGIDF